MKLIILIQNKYIAKCEANAVPDAQINTKDIPELTKEEFARGHFKYWKPVKEIKTLYKD